MVEQKQSLQTCVQYKLREEIALFIHDKEKFSSELSDPNLLFDFARLCDIMEHFAQIIRRLQGCKQVITQIYDMVTAFCHKLDLWKSQVKQDDPAYLPVCESILVSL